MRSMWKSILALALTACASSESGAPGPAEQPAVAAVTAPQPECEPVTSLEIVHTVSGAPVTSKVRLAPEISADPAQALAAFQRAADYFGAATIVSSKQVTDVMCFPAAPDEEGLAPRQLRKHSALVADPNGGDLCIGDSTVEGCAPLTPTSQFPYSDGTSSCTITNLGEAAQFTCNDSGLIVSTRGDAVVTINSANVRAEVLERTAVLRRLLGDANVLTNFHFNVVINPDTQAALVDNAAYNQIAQALAQAANAHLPLPDVQQLLSSLPNAPTNVAFAQQLQKAYQTRADRLKLLSEITTGARLNNAQVNAFYNLFVGKSQAIDKLVVQHSTASLQQAMTSVNQTISQLANTSPASTIYEQVKAGARALLESQTTSGVFDPDAEFNSYVPHGLYQFLTDADIEKQILASESLISFNETLRKSDALPLVEATSPLLKLLSVVMGDDNMDASEHIYDQVLSSEFFVESTNPNGTRFDVHLTPEAKTMFSIDISADSAKAYDVIVTLNEVADYNKQTGKVTVDYQAIISLNARQALKTSDALRAIYHTEEASSWLRFLKGGGKGAITGLGDMASGIFHMVRHPVETYEGLKAAVVNWDQTLLTVWSQGVELIHRWPNMTPEEKGEFLGNLAAQVYGDLPLEALKAGRIEEVINDAVKLHLDEANLGLRITERTGLALGPEAASELAREMEHLGLSNVDEMAEIAHDLEDYLPCSLTGAAPFANITAPKLPCTALELKSAGNLFATLRKELGIDGALLAETEAGMIKARMKQLEAGLWESGEELLWGRRGDGQSRIEHVMEHLANNTSKDLQGVFDAAIGRKGVLPLIDEGWSITKNGPKSRWQKVGTKDGGTYYRIDMGRPIGICGGRLGSGKESSILGIILQVGTNRVITAYPCPDGG